MPLTTKTGLSGNHPESVIRGLRNQSQKVPLANLKSNVWKWAYSVEKVPAGCAGLRFWIEGE